MQYPTGMKESQKSLGEKLKQVREAANISQETAVEELDISQPTLSKWEADVTKPSVDGLLNICRTYRTTLNVIFRDTEYEEMIDPNDRGIYHIDSELFFKLLHDFEMKHTKSLEVTREQNKQILSLIEKLIAILGK